MSVAIGPLARSTRATEGGSGREALRWSRSPLAILTDDGPAVTTAVLRRVVGRTRHRVLRTLVLATGSADLHSTPEAAAVFYPFSKPPISRKTTLSVACRCERSEHQRRGAKLTAGYAIYMGGGLCSVLS